MSSPLALDLARALDPVEAASDAGWSPDPWQARALRSTAKRMLWVCSRRSGKTSTAALIAAHHAIYNPGHTVLIVSPSQRQSIEMLREVRAHLRRMGRTDDGTAHELRFESGSRVISLPGESNTVRGYTAHALILDEASRIPDEMYLSVRPMIATTNGRLLALSTPNGRQGWFFRAAQDAERGEGDWELIRVPAYECPRLSPDFLLRERAEMGDRAFRTEYLCEFVDLDEAMYRAQWIEEARDASIRPLFPIPPKVKEFVAA